jgi:prolyl-tRNA synthetase
MKAERGIEVGNIFKLGTWFSEAMGCTFSDENGENQPVVMGSYGIGVGRLLACIAEQHHGEQGLCWPISVAPYPVHLVLVPSKDDPQPQQAADQLYEDLQAAGIDVLYDDRAESAGIKFNDADLIGLPIRMTIGARSLKNGGVEIKRRDQAERSIVPLIEAIQTTQQIIAALWDEINQSLVEVSMD